VNKAVRVSLSEAEIDVLLKVGAAELLRQVHKNYTDPLLVRIQMKAVKAKEKFNAIIREGELK